MRAALRSFFYSAAMAAMASPATAASMDPTQGAPVSPPGIAMIVVLAVCFVALVGLVVTLPAVTKWFRRLLHIGPALPPHTVTGAHRSP
jgi:hypothetical protein